MNPQKPTLEEVLAVTLYAYAQELQCRPEDAMDNFWNFIAEEVRENYDDQDPVVSVTKALKRVVYDVEAMIRAIYDLSGWKRRLMLEKATRALELVRNHS